MKILVLNGSPRANGNTAFLVDAFKKGAEKAGNTVNVMHVGGMNISGCKGCNYCRTTGNGECAQKDDMDKVYEALAETDMVVFASSVYYWGFTAQMQAALTRFYCKGNPGIGKYAMILSSGSPNVYEGITYSYERTLGFFGAENCGIKTIAGAANKTAEAAAELEAFGESLA